MHFSIESVPCFIYLTQLRRIFVAGGCCVTDSDNEEIAERKENTPCVSWKRKK